MSEPSWTDLAPKAEEPAEGKKWNVFLSYRSVNRPWVLNLYDQLRARGNEVFLDQVVLKGGAKLISTLRKNLRLSQAGILIWSKAAKDSEWVENEYETMEAMAIEDESFNFVPVCIDDTPLPGFAGNRVFFDFSAYPGRTQRRRTPAAPARDQGQGAIARSGPFRLGAGHADEESHRAGQDREGSGQQGEAR